MKKLLLIALLVVSLAVSADALTITDVTIGSATQERVHNVTGTVTVRNTHATTALTNVLLTSTATSAYNVRFTGPTTIAAGASESYTVKIDIPDNHDGVDADLKEAKLKVGTLTATGTLGTTPDTGSSDLYVQAVNQLEINRVRVVCDTKSQSVEDNEEVSNVLPGQTCTLEIEVENKFDDSSDNGEKITDIEFASMRFSVDSSNGDVDVDIDGDFDDLGPEDKDTADGTIEIDDEADRDATIRVEVSATDENGAKHGMAMSFDMEIKRLTHDVQIKRATANPEVVDNCEEGIVRVTVSVSNMGKRDEREAAVEISVPDLKFIEKEPDFELDKDDSRSVVFDIPVPKGTSPGVYSADIRTFFDTIAPSNSGKVEFTVSACSIPEEEEDDEPTVIIVKNDTTPTVVQPPVIPSSSAKAAPQKSAGTNALYVGLLIVLNVLLLAAVVVVAVVFTRKK